MKIGVKKIFFLILFISLFFVFPDQIKAEEIEVDGSILYTYQSISTDGTAFLKNTNGIIYPQGATKIDEVYIFFHGTNPPFCTDNTCHLIEPSAVCKEFKLCEKVAIRQSIKGKTRDGFEIPRKNIAILIPQVNPKSGDEVNSFTAPNFTLYLQEAIAQLRSKLPESPDYISTVIGHGKGAGIVNRYQTFYSPKTIILLDGCYQNWCEEIYRRSIRDDKNNFFYINPDTDKTINHYNKLRDFYIDNPGEAQDVSIPTSIKDFLQISTEHYKIPEQCFLDHVLNDDCKSKPPDQPKTTELETILADINASKPKLEIDFQGVQFATVTVSTDDVGDNYIVIPWIAQFISTLYKFGIGVSSIVAVIIIIIQGIRIIASGGGENTSEGYKKITHAVIGLVIAWGSFAILYNINPNLVEFNGLKVKVVKEDSLLETNDIILEDASSTSPLPNGAYDFIFKMYANCVGIDWRILRMIAKAESNLTPDIINKAGFIGFFQTKPTNCRGIFGKSTKYTKYASMCTVENLQTPAFNTAVGALYQKNALNLINTYCKDAPINLQLTIFYNILSSGEGATKSVLKSAQANGGCTEKNLRDGFAKFWHNHKKPGQQKGDTARWFINYMKPGYCQEFADPLDCMGTKKFDHTLKAANKLVSQGINSVKVQPSGACPLDTDTPFPSM